MSGGSNSSDGIRDWPPNLLARIATTIGRPRQEDVASSALLYVIQTDDNARYRAFPEHAFDAWGRESVETAAPEPDCPVIHRTGNGIITAQATSTMTKAPAIFCFGMGGL
jgi:hypothetical protein